jgi:hypothetical protein
MNARASENYLTISRSSSTSKSVEIFWAEIYWGRLFFRAESSLIQSRLTIACLNLMEPRYEPGDRTRQFTFNRAVVPYEI